MRQIIICVMFILGGISTAWADAPPRSTPPLKVLVLPAEIKIFLLTAANTLDEQPDASDLADDQTQQFVQQSLLNSQSMALMPMPALSPAEQTTLKQYVALYKVIEVSAETAKRMGGPWSARIDNFDYTVGPGLQFLQQRSGADAVLIVWGTDVESTAGHMAITLLNAALGIGGVQGRNYIAAGLIDLHTGHCRWLDTDHANARDFTNPEVLRKLVAGMLQEYPVGEIHSDE
jgi:hypothetical protein